MFRYLLERRREHSQIHLVVEGLHRCDTSWKELVGILTEVFGDDSLHGKLKVALFYRERADISEALGEVEEFRFKGPDLNGSPAKRPLSPLVSRVISDSPTLSIIQPVLSDTLTRCKDVTEMSLTIQSVQDDNGPRRTFNSMMLLLKDLPPCTADTVFICFKRLLSWGRIALGWVTHAKRPLSLNEIAVAVALTERQDSFTRGFDTQDFPIDSAAEVQYSFGSLLIIDNGYVTFGNDEVKQCFLNCLANEKQMQSEGADQVETEEKMEVAVPDETQITRVLLGYISLPELLGLTRLPEQNSNPDSPHGLHLNLARYAVQFWPIHYRAAARVQPEDESMSKMLRHIDCGNLSRLYTDLNPAALPPGILINNLFLLAAQLGFTNVIKAQDLDAEGEHGSTAIELASWNGHVETVKHLLRSCPSQRSGDLGQSCTHATIRGYVSVVELLLEHQKQTGNLPTLELEKLLGLAAQLGYKDQISLFSVYGADIDSSIEGVTPLQHAAENGYTSIAKYLLDAKNADVDAKSGTAKDPPIMLAASNGHLGVVRLLVAAGAEMATETNDHRTPLYVASKNGHESTVRCLLHHARVKGGNSERRIIDFRGPGGKTPLVAACSGKHAGTAHSLLEYGADVAITDDDTFSAAYYAICHGNSVLAESILEKRDTKNPIQGCGEMFVRAAEHGLVKVIHILMDSPMASNGVKLWNIEGGEGRTALHYAAQGGWIEIIHMLLEAGANVNKEDRNGSAPLELAAVAGEVETMKSLLSCGATAVKALAESETMLVRVAKSKPHKSHGEVVKILLDEAVDPNTKSSEEVPLLNVAVAAGNHGVVKTLLESPVDTKMESKWGWSPLHEAANWYRGSVKTSRLLVKAGIDPLGVDVDGWLPAHLAARSGNIQLLNFLTELHPKCLNSTDVDGLTPLHLAAFCNEPEALTWLLANSGEMNAQDNNNETAIMKAAASGCDASVRILMAAHADLSLRNKDGKTPLHYAARAGEIEIGRFILQGRSDILCWRDDNNYSALHEAIVNSEPEFAEMLLDEFYGTDDTGSLKDLSAAAKPNGRTPLISAVYGNQNQVVRRLLERKAEVEMRDSQNMSALRAAVDRDSGEIIDLLLDSSLTKFADINAGGGAQPTALHEAARKGKKILVSRLIYLGARVNAEGGQHNTALSAAAFSGYDEIVELLLQNGADASLHGGNLPNALGAAIYSETYELVESLIKAGADVNAKDNQGRTSVHLAARRGSWRVLHNLISEHGGDSSLTDTQGRKVVHHAAMSGDVELVVSLLDDEPDHSLDLDLPDSDGWTPLHHACRNGANFEVVEALVARGADVLKTTKDGWTAESLAVFHDAGDIANYIRAQCQNMEKLPLAQNWKIGESCTAWCDGCLLWPMIGMRWRCQDCQDFDFCFKCYWTAEQTHPDHKFISIPETDGIPSRGPEVIQEVDSECRSEGSATQSTDSGRRSDA
ncbi:hypothetical protein Daus18300_005439 [Diaporthe australafricana]|uniref:ZZ-type domain-containing protein n=1 Tax=Diaporthe australafricana TaxID=127596 RepID=A0ABR3X1B5_9PEZI